MNQNDGKLSSAEELLESFDLADTALAEFRIFGETAIPKIDDFLSDFYEWLETRPEYPQFFQDPEVLERAQRRQKEYWLELLSGEINNAYVEKRRAVGEMHVVISLPPEVYLVAMNFSMIWFSNFLRDQDYSKEDAYSILQTLATIFNLDQMLVMETFSRRSSEVIAQQTRSLLELSTPVIKVWEGIVMLPLVGVIDTLRASQIMEGLLESIVQNEAKVGIIDITGVPVIDTHVAESLLKTVTAAKMLGTEMIVTGISPEGAQTLVKLGTDLAGIRTSGTLQAGMVEALRLLDYKVVQG